MNFRRPTLPDFTHALKAIFGLLLVAALGYLGGVGMTSLFPTTVTTKYYAADVRLGLVPDSTARLPTMLGDLSVEFDGPLPAPGLLIDPQLRRDVTEAFTDGAPSVSTFQPTAQELDAAARAALVGVAWRFLLGFGLVVVVLLGARALWRRPFAATAATAFATTLALVAPALAGFLTYREDNIGAVRTTSLLSVARQDMDLLGDLERRGAESSRYVVSALALSDALQSKYTPAAKPRPTALRVLFISDIHGANQYALLKDLVTTQKIDAVVDSGDLINFGSVQEAEAAGIFDDIADLGVPYLFVRGNHDASSANDTSLVSRLSRIPNVVTLQPDSKSYQKVRMAGVTFGGFNDPRYYGDNDPKLPALQENARKAFVRAWKDGEQTQPDVVVSHEPAATKDGFTADQLLISGHTHKPAREDNRMTVGTFTGGGLFGAKIAITADAGTEVLTQSYSFDIAEFDTSCSLATVRRYTFSGILVGRPQIESTTVLSGRQFVPEAKDRTCGGSTDPVVTPIQMP
ncbi:metallophosphoesterase [Yimella sp. cx-51]|uniref:metallophosphoesterase family protein n=1 Tax=Yimella sp. cx-51 TaxID=2770551 RepID=UPI00165E06EE|nr:metallophosphoesterase [Yimella sp. cx-51]MBC9956523.1 metallophosphoesterase [Yimella sp. cx-51]QTH38371.1 metallophosphoesterase [Yimella sp. cx-51]